MIKSFYGNCRKRDISRNNASLRCCSENKQISIAMAVLLFQIHKTIPVLYYMDFQSKFRDLSKTHATFSKIIRHDRNRIVISAQTTKNWVYLIIENKSETLIYEINYDNRQFGLVKRTSFY